MGRHLPTVLTWANDDHVPLYIAHYYTIIIALHWREYGGVPFAVCYLCAFDAQHSSFRVAVAVVVVAAAAAAAVIVAEIVAVIVAVVAVVVAGRQQQEMQEEALLQQWEAR